MHKEKKGKRKNRFFTFVFASGYARLESNVWATSKWPFSHEMCNAFLPC